MIGLLGLFAAAFLAASPLPFNSEVVFLALQSQGWHPLPLVLAASLGNILGSCLTYGVGRWLNGFRDHPRSPVTPDQLARAERWFARWGLWTLLLTWVPGADVLVAAAGVMRAPFLPFLILVALAKTSRYIVLALLAAGILGWPPLDAVTLSP